jgi:hypothetical protein
MKRIENFSQAMRVISELRKALDDRQTLVGELTMRNAQLTVKCDLFSASLAQADKTIEAVTRELGTVITLDVPVDLNAGYCAPLGTGECSCRKFCLDPSECSSSPGMAPATSQKPVPALSEPDHMPAYSALQAIIDYPDSGASDDAGKMKLIAIAAMTSAAQLVQQRALSDDECHELRSTAAINADLWAESQDFDPTQEQVSGVFVRAILAAAGAA